MTFAPTQGGQRAEQGKSLPGRLRLQLGLAQCCIRMMDRRRSENRGNTQDGILTHDIPYGLDGCDRRMNDEIVGMEKDRFNEYFQRFVKRRRMAGKDSWRRRRDSNPRYTFRAYNSLANCRLQPLGHVSMRGNCL
jgi:hypothetical protein